MSVTLIRSHFRFSQIAGSVLFLAAGCSVSGGQKSPEKGPVAASLITAGRTISFVEARLAEGLPSDLTETAEAYDVTGILKSQIERQLDISLNSSGSLTVEVEVVGMRLRSNGTAIWWGLLAGVDWVTARVAVKEGTTVLKTFETGTSTSLGGFAMGARSLRVRRMMRSLADRIAKKI